MCMIYLPEFLASDLFRPSIVKIPGSGVGELICNNFTFFLLYKTCAPLNCCITCLMLLISDLHEKVDFVACLGGDGVILHSSNLFRGPVPPVISFNLGSLGFLTTHSVCFSIIIYFTLKKCRYLFVHLFDFHSVFCL